MKLEIRSSLAMLALFASFSIAPVASAQGSLEKVAVSLHDVLER